MTRLEYCQFLLSTQTNYTLTHFAEHSQGYSHDRINRYLRNAELRPSMLWKSEKPDIEQDEEEGYLVFDDTVIDKEHSFKIEAVRRQWSGASRSVIKGIGVVTCVYVNARSNRWWVIDYRLYNPALDGKRKPGHVSEMLNNAITHKKLQFSTVLMDSWYASKTLMQQIDGAGKTFYCPIKSNRLVCEHPNQKEHVAVSGLEWSENESRQGKQDVHLNKFPKGFRLKLFRVRLSTKRTDYVVSNTKTQATTDDARTECAIRWKIEQFHREIKQNTGIERCQCRKERIQRNHIACAMLVWVRFNKIAHQTGKTIYRLKQGLLDDYLIRELREPAIPMSFA